MFLIFKHNGINNNNSMWFISNYFDVNYQAAYKMFEMNGSFNMTATPLNNFKIKFTIDTPRQYGGSIYLFFLN